jgi:hypothetical protein
MNALRNGLMRASRSGFTIVLAFVFGFLGSQAATIVSARGGDGNVINACVNSSSGEIKVVAANAACRKGEYHVDWNTGGGQNPGGITGLEVVWNSTPFSGDPQTLAVYCPPGKKAIGGGVANLNPASVVVSRPVGVDIGEPYYDQGVPTGTSGTSTKPAGWMGRYTGYAQVMAVYAICANAAP